MQDTNCSSAYIIWNSLDSFYPFEAGENVIFDLVTSSGTYTISGNTKIINGKLVIEICDEKLDSKRTK